LVRCENNNTRAVNATSQTKRSTRRKKKEVKAYKEIKKEMQDKYSEFLFERQIRYSLRP
jgi:hypothetical protein